MEEKKNNKNIWILTAVIIIIVIVISVPSLLESKRDADLSKLEYNLINEGKIVPAEDIVEQFSVLLSQKKYDEAEEYLSEECKIIDDKGTERVALKYCFENLDEYSSHKLEKRGNDLQNQETYRVLWNGSTYEDTEQFITIELIEKIETNQITYEIIRIIFTDNTK